MLLSQQIQAILYHFMMGWIYGCSFSFICMMTTYVRYSFIKAIFEISYHIVFTLILYYGIYKINGGISNPYLFVLFIMGVFIFYKAYFIVFDEIFSTLLRPLRPIYKKLSLVKSQILGIIKVSLKRCTRRRKHGRAKEKKREETNAPDAPFL